MFFKRSIRRSFLIQLIFALAVLIVLFSSMLYFYIEESIYDEKKQELVLYAKNIANNKSITQFDDVPDTFLSISVGIITIKKDYGDIKLYKSRKNNRTFLTLFYPFDIDDNTYIKITREVTHTQILLEKILNYIFIINIAGFLLVVVYAVGLSKMLVTPVKTLSSKLSNMNEYLMQPIKVESLPEEFEPLGTTINHLINRIQNFVKYQKELFIGTAHELKTPLSVIKLKNQVTLIKKRSPEEYIDALKTTNKTIDEMNVVVSNILNIGRQEGAQLDKPVEIDVIEFLRKKAEDFRLLAENEHKKLYMSFEPDGYMANLQIGLLNQIIQNFLQNALKFTPENKSVTIRSSQNSDGLLIEVIDEGCGIDESMDLFAPFKRQGDKCGVGLGLFLAKSAADGLNAKIELKNREDGVNGTVASLLLTTFVYLA